MSFFDSRCLQTSNAVLVSRQKNILRRNIRPFFSSESGKRYSANASLNKSFQGKGLGVALLQDAVVRTAQAGGILGIRGLLVHALSIEARAFL